MYNERFYNQSPSETFRPNCYQPSHDDCYYINQRSPIIDDYMAVDPFFYEKHYNQRAQQQFTTKEALSIANAIGIDFDKTLFDVEQFRMGLDVELEHGNICPQTNVTSDDPILTGKIALVHLFEIPDYYTRLDKMEEQGDAYWSKKEYDNPCY